MSTEHGAATAANGGDRNGGAEASVTATDDNDGQAAPYQLLPALSEAEYAALRESIADLIGYGAPVILCTPRGRYRPGGSHDLIHPSGW